jgi:membrane protease YdiL (CAAX protease family)
MDALNPDTPPASVEPPPGPPRVWKFWGTALWGLVIFAANSSALFCETWLSAAAAASSASFSTASRAMRSLSMVLLMLWFAIRRRRIPFADYLGLRGTSWKNVIIGIVALVVLVGAWDLVSRAAGREVTPGFMGDVLKSAQEHSALWLLVIAFAVAAPLWEELFARGWLYRGWSESSLGPYGAILLSSLVWTAMHLQYDWFFLCEVLSIGLLFGYLRFRTGSTWLTILLHGLNNLAATIQTWWLAG